MLVRSFSLRRLLQHTSGSSVSTNAPAARTIVNATEAIFCSSPLPGLKLAVSPSTPLTEVVDLLHDSCVGEIGLVLSVKLSVLVEEVDGKLPVACMREPEDVSNRIVAIVPGRLDKAVTISVNLEVGGALMEDERTCRR